MVDLELDAVAAKFSNWGRWGVEDELGTLNFITIGKRVEAAGMVRSGKVFSLAVPIDEHVPSQPISQRRPLPWRTMLETGTDVRLGRQPGGTPGHGWADDVVTMNLQAATHWDALSHVFHDFKMYNNRDCDLVTSLGAEKNSIVPQCDRLITRGILVDAARQVGVDCLPLGYCISPEEIDSALDRQGAEVGSGDVVLIRTGNLGRARATGTWERFIDDDEPGIGLDVVPWLHEHEVAAVACDNWAVEVLPSGAIPAFPVHVAALVYLGLPLGEMFDLDALAADCAEDGMWEFLFSGVPLPFTGAVGSPVNPMAIK